MLASIPLGSAQLGSSAKNTSGGLRVPVEAGIFSLSGAPLKRQLFENFSSESFSVVGAEINLNRSIKHDTGGFVSTINSASFISRMSASTGVFSSSGQPIDKGVSELLSFGGFAYEGADLSLNLSFKADVGVFGSSVQDVSFSEGSSFAVQDGSFGLSGYDISFNFARTGKADIGVLSLNGQDATLVKDVRLPTEAKSFTTQGQDIDFGFGEAFPALSFGAQGQDALLLKDIRLTAGERVFVSQGQPIQANVSLPVGAGLLAVEGQGIAARKDLKLTSETGSFLTDGQDTQLTRTFVRDFGFGVFTVIENDARVGRSYSADIEPLLFGLEGNEVESPLAKVVRLDKGAFSFEPQVIVTETGFGLIADPAQFTLELQEFLPAFRLSVQNGVFTYSGFNFYRVSASAAIFDLAGQDARLLRGKARRASMVVKQGNTSSSFYIKQNDTSPSLLAELQDSLTNQVINLLNVEGSFHMWRLDTKEVVLKKPINVVSSGEGIIRYDWEQGDTAVPGLYQAEIQITYPDQTIESFPNDGYISVEIIEEIA